MSDDIEGPFKYKVLEEKIKIDDPKIQEYVKALKELISYQFHIIKQQRVEIIAYKHEEAWKRYDKEAWKKYDKE